MLHLIPDCSLPRSLHSHSLISHLFSSSGSAGKKFRRRNQPTRGKEESSTQINQTTLLLLLSSSQCDALFTLSAPSQQTLAPRFRLLSLLKFCLALEVQLLKLLLATHLKEWFTELCTSRPAALHFAVGLLSHKTSSSDTRQLACNGEVRPTGVSLFTTSGR